MDIQWQQCLTIGPPYTHGMWVRSPSLIVILPESRQPPRKLVTVQNTYIQNPYFPDQDRCLGVIWIGIQGVLEKCQISALFGNFVVFTT